MNISIDNIITHDLNPNVMSRKNKTKLKRLIKDEKNYPPLIVNKKSDDNYLLLDGHQRLSVLKDLGYTEIKCDVWDVDEKTELQLLATMNKLRGKSAGDKKRILFTELQKHLKPRQIETLIPERKDFYKELFAKQEEKKATLDKVEAKILFVNNLSKERYDFVMKYIKDNITTEKAEEAVYWLVQRLIEGNGKKV